jgi:hypothetical protein
LESEAVNVSDDLVDLSVNRACRIIHFRVCRHPHDSCELRQQLVIHVRLNVLYLHHDDSLEELLVHRNVAADPPAECDPVLSLQSKLAFESGKKLLTDRLPAKLLQCLIGGGHLLKRAKHVSVIELLWPFGNQCIGRVSESSGSPEFVQNGRIWQKGLGLIIKQELNELMENI